MKPRIDYAEKRIEAYSRAPFKPGILQMSDQAQYEMNLDCRLLADILRMLDEFFKDRTAYKGSEAELFHVRETIKERLNE
jgi:hypothetical protein